MNRKIAICIPLSKIFLKETLELYNNLDEKFNLSFMKNKLCRPHITLFGGSTNKLEKIKKELSKIKISETNRKIDYLGMGMFVNDKATFYLRFSSEKIFLEIRKKLITSTGSWFKIENILQNKMWIPKSSIIHNELSIKDKSFIKVLKFLNTWKFSKKNFLIEEITVIDFTEFEHELVSFKI
tara:strand:- start:293 stop:838 length:546 start_codon:yes stop_codon:yes gene_type:complete